MSKMIDFREQTKLLRQTLKEAFPDTRFSVRLNRYAGGSSINVNWEDGPTASLVSEISSIFEGSTFDGMTDSKKDYVHVLDNEIVQFLSDYIITNRDTTMGVPEEPVLPKHSPTRDRVERIGVSGELTDTQKLRWREVKASMNADKLRDFVRELHLEQKREQTPKPARQRNRGLGL